MSGRMALDGTLGIFDEIQMLVSDKLQVVSYKWLSRNFSVSSSDAKRLLQEFVDKHGNEFEVIYSLSGRLKSNPQVHRIQLISGLKIAEVKQEFKDGFSIQVYSVQASIPKDPAALWNAEFLQAQELFNQPSTVDNCLRNSRFSGVSNSLVKRNVDGKMASFIPPQPKRNLGVPLTSKNNGVLLAPSAPQPQQKQAQQQSPKIVHQVSSVETTDSKDENITSEGHAQNDKPNVDKKKVQTKLANKTKSQSEKNSGGGSLANLWGRASVKPKPTSPFTENPNDASNLGVTAEAQISTHEAVDDVSSDDERQHINCKRDSNGEGSRKRRVVFDFSDEEDDFENVVSLASPDPPETKSTGDSKKHLNLEAKDLSFEEPKQEELDIKQEKIKESVSGTSKENLENSSKNKKTKYSSEKTKYSSEKTQSHDSETLNAKREKEEAIDSATMSPKRKKVLKTRIDERGREVTEVVWEGETVDISTTDKNTVANNHEKNATNIRPPANKTLTSGPAPASSMVGKAGNKKTGKAGVKDAKQGNIMSFFKKA